MHPEIAVLARKHVMTPELLAELDALWGRRFATAATLVEGYEPVRLSFSTESDPTLDELPTDETDESSLVAGRYADLGPIGVGGMSEVRRVRDVALNRTLAMKLIHPSLLGRPVQVARFLEEAQTTAQLQHPGIVPVHDLGTLPDGRIWFTMKEVRGRTLTEVIREVHAASLDGWGVGGPRGSTFRRLVAAFMQACHAVAHAHERGVVHRDIKPDNVMVGSHGEVLVLDWGLAKVLGRADRTGTAAEDTVVSTRPDAAATRMGAVFGTPVYMAPEQARGDVDRIDARTDVYALGAVLYEILSGRPPYDGGSAVVLAAVRAGPPPPPGRPDRAPGLGPAGGPPSGPQPPAELVAACERAMSRDPAGRYASARALADEIEAWLDGVRLQEQAVGVVARAVAGVAEAEVAVARAAALRAESAALLSEVAGWEPEERKVPGWTKAAEAEAADLAARLRQLEVDQTLLAALQISPGLPEAHAVLAERFLARHRAAEDARDLRAAAEAQALLEAHAGALPDPHSVRRRMAAYLEGHGALTLVTDPPGAEVLLFRWVERHRRLVEVFDRSLGPTPLRAVSLPMGSYLCVLRHPACDEVRHPVEIGRRGHWDGVAPDERSPDPVWLPPKGTIGPDEVYLAPGWFYAGGGPGDSGLSTRRLWCDALVMHRFAVTNRRYIAFLDDLVAQGREEEALQHAPRERPTGEGPPGALPYHFDGRRFSLEPDLDQDVWLPDWPVLRVDWHGARAFLASLSTRTGREWRLPGEHEWERAARGADGRTYPWGNFADPAWCCMADSHAGPQRLPQVVDSFPVDCSPHGVRGLAGNVMDWCLDLFGRGWAGVTPEGRVRPPDERTDAPPRALRVLRGGSWSSNHRSAATRLRIEPRSRTTDVGFRGVYRVVPP